MDDPHVHYQEMHGKQVWMQSSAGAIALDQVEVPDSALPGCGTRGVSRHGGDPRRPLVCDMSSDLLSRLVELSHYSLIYAGAQRIGSIQAFCVPSPGRTPPPAATLRAAASPP